MRTERTYVGRSGCDVNNAAQVRPTLDALAAVAEHGIAVVLVHHSAKPGPQGYASRGPMGSQSISAVTRRTISLCRTGRFGCPSCTGTCPP